MTSSACFRSGWKRCSEQPYTEGRMPYAPCIINLTCLYENRSYEKDGTGRTPLGRCRPFCSKGRPVLAPQKLEQLPGLSKPAFFARPSQVGADQKHQGGFSVGSSPYLCRYRRKQSSARCRYTPQRTESVGE